MQFLKWLKQMLHLRKEPKSNGKHIEPLKDYENATYMAKDEDYPTWPPPPPQVLLDRSDEFWSTVQSRKYAGPRGHFEDQPLFALYRLYECFVLDKVIQYRNVLEYFWRQHQWSVRDIPDPQDTDPARYAFLAGSTYLIARSFNARVKLGLTRNAKPLMSMEEAEEAKRVPDELRPYEKPPDWARLVPPLDETLKIPTDDGTVLDSKSDDRTDPDFLEKNILIWTPHIYFT